MKNIFVSEFAEFSETLRENSNISRFSLTVLAISHLGQSHHYQYTVSPLIYFSSVHPQTL